MRTTTLGASRARRAAAALLLAAVLPVGLAACGGEPDRARTGADAVAAGTTDGSTGGDGEQDGGSEPSGGTSSGDVGRLEQVLATSEGEFERTPNEQDVRVPVRLDLTALERIDGDAVELRFTLTNTGDVTWEPWDALGKSGFGGWGASDVVLLDLPGDRKYLSLVDSEDNCLCTSWVNDEVTVPAGESHDFYVRFVAPPEDVTSIEVQVPGFAPLSGVEISS